MSVQDPEAAMAEPAAVGVGRDEPVYFNGEVWPVCKMVFKFTLLTIITLGIYRFWAKTRLRQYFWSQTEFDGDRFEYLGTPKELFIGFLIVMAILAPVFFAAEFIGTLVASNGVVPTIIYQFCYLLTFLVLIQVAIYRMSRYRLTRTSWRGVRFGLDGNAWHFCFMALVAMATIIGSIGIAYPWMRNWLIRYRVENMRFGDSYFHYSGQASMLRNRWWIGLAVCVSPFVVAAIVSGIPDLAEIENFFSQLEAEGKVAGDDVPAAFAAYSIAYGVAVLAAIVMYIWYRVGEYRAVVSHISLGEATMDSSLSTARIFGLVGMMVGLFVLLFACTVGAFVVIQGPGAASSGGIVAFIFVFVAFFIGFSVIPTGIYGTLMTRAVLTSLRVYNKQSLTDIAQGDQSKMKYGEGLADAFDVGAF
ncbi:MAG: YjgN family protein [Alphaproteobacteria bacterium]